jgi:DNA-directed RNA polymerase sigma subunit (sigma70/sigma32)
VKFIAGPDGIRPALAPRGSSATFENLTLREIGEVLGVTESRVSQFHTKAVLGLRSRFQSRPL